MVVGIIYLVFAGPILLPKTGGLFCYAKDHQKDLVTEVQVQFNPWWSHRIERDRQGQTGKKTQTGRWFLQPTSLLEEDTYKLMRTASVRRLFSDVGPAVGIAVQVDKSSRFKHLGQPVGLALAMLGLHRDTLVKIRRRHHSKVHIPSSVSDSASKQVAPLGPGPPTAEGGLAMGDGSVAAARDHKEHAAVGEERKGSLDPQDSAELAGVEGMKETGDEGVVDDGLLRGEDPGAGRGQLGEEHASVALAAGQEEQRRVRAGSGKKVMFRREEAKSGRSREGKGGKRGEGDQQVRPVEGGFVDLYPVSMNELLQVQTPITPT